jgi:protein TonB
MFDAIGAGNERGRALKALLFGVSVTLHAGGIVALVLWSFWTIEKLAPKSAPLYFQAATQPPPPPPPPAAPPAPQKVTPRTPKVIKDTVQPIVKPDPDPRPDPEPTATGNPDGPTDPNATGPGDPNGVPGGTGTTPCVGDGCGKPEIVEPPKVIDMKTAEAQRLSGTRDIPLPPAVAQTLRAQGQNRAMAMVRLCLSTDGAPTSVTFVRSTGFPEADARIRDEVQAWRYRPYAVNGRAVRVCTAVQFVYQLE